MKTKNQTTLPLLPGETPLPDAPSVSLDDGTNCVPQHYLSYHHDRLSIENIVAEIDFDKHYILFVDEDNSSIFLQVGIIGKDNYINVKHQKNYKIVYGRKWRVEPQLPSSEVIQTAFLAICKAREHEVRELFKLKTLSDDGISCITSPFSCHQDLPLIANTEGLRSQANEKIWRFEKLQKIVSNVRYDHASIKLLRIEKLSNQEFLVKFEIKADKKTSLPEISHNKTAYHCVIDGLNENTLLFGIFDVLLGLSNRYVEEHFRFLGSPRFSRSNSIFKIARLSVSTRIHSQEAASHTFNETFANANYETDTSRVPNIFPGKLGKKIKTSLNSFVIDAGIMPKIQRHK